LDAGPAAAGAGDLDGGDPLPAVGQQPERLGAQEHAEAPGVLEAPPVDVGEARDRADLHDPRRRDRGVDLERRAREPRPDRGEVVEAEAAEAEQRLRALVPGVELGAAERPAAPGEPLPRRQVLLVERAAVARPRVRVAAEVPVAGRVRGEARPGAAPRDDAGGPAGGVGGRTPSALDEDDAQARVEQAERDGDAGGSAPDDADVRLDGAAGKVEAVDDHAARGRGSRMAARWPRR